MIQGAVDMLFATADAVGRWLLSTSAQVAVLGLVVAAVDRAIGGRRWPPLRAALWWLVLASAAAPAAIRSPLSVWALDHPISRWCASWTAEARPPADALAVLTKPPTNSRSPASAVLPAVVAFAWSSGAVLVAGLMIRRAIRLRRAWLISVADAAPDWFASLMERAARRVGLRKAPAIVISHAATGPAVFGAFRPVVVIPHRLLHGASREQLEHVLLHELFHVRRCDAIASLAVSLLHVLYWFHPVVRLARIRLDALREVGCDESVARSLRGDAPRYRRTLLHMARTLLVQPDAAPLGFVHHHSQIMMRLAYLQRPLSNRPAMTRIFSSLVFAASLALVLPQGRLVSSTPDHEVNLDELPGCLQLRYAVLRAMADQQQAVAWNKNN